MYMYMCISKSAHLNPQMAYLCIPVYMFFILVYTCIDTVPCCVVARLSYVCQLHVLNPQLMHCTYLQSLEQWPQHTHGHELLLIIAKGWR